MSINLGKGDKISLSKPGGGGGLTKVSVGLGWAKKKGFLGLGSTDVDLDASCILFQADKAPVDAVFFGQLFSKDGSIRHTGDDRSGGGGENDPNETIHVTLPDVPAQVNSIVFVVNSYSGETFKGIPSAFCNVVDLDTGKEVARFNLATDGGAHRGFVIAKVVREGGGWQFAALGEVCSGRQQTIDDILPQAAQLA